MVNFDRGMQIPAIVSRPDLSPEKMEVSDYSGERNAKIAQLEQQIAMVKERIARNERALTGKSYEDANNQIAALEMRKINSSDPTTLWRWQQQRQDTKVANANTKANAAAQFANTVDMWVNTRPAPTTEGIMQQISNLNSAIRDGKNAGADVSKLQTKKEELEALVYGDDDQSVNTESQYVKGTDTEKLKAEVKDVISRATTSSEVAQYIEQKRKDLDPEQINELNNKRRELKKKEKAKAESEKFERYVKSRGYKNGSKSVPPKILANLKRHYKEINK